MAIQPIPDGYPNVIPFIIASGASGVIDFLVAAFEAKEQSRMSMPDGTVAHAEVTIGDSMIMLSDGSPEYPPAPAVLHLYVTDVDETFGRAVAAGATVEREPTNEFYGDRVAAVKDAWGNRWSIATHVEDVSNEEMQRRMEQLPRQ